MFIFYTEAGDGSVLPTLLHMCIEGVKGLY
jgi:hypothetical protein